MRKKFRKGIDIPKASSYNNKAVASETASE